MNDHAVSFRQQIIGSALVFLGAILFSTKAIMVKWAYRISDIDSISLLALRMLFALPFFLLIGWWAHQKSKQDLDNAISKSDWLKVIGLGICGYYMASLFDFLGLQYITAGLERLVLFMYPTLVLLLSLYFGKSVNKAIYIALPITYIGIGIGFWGSAGTGQNENLALGAFLVFLAAITFAIYIYGSGNLIPRIGAKRYTALAMTFAAMGILIQHGLTKQFQLFHYSSQIYWLSFLMAIVATVIPSFIVSEGIKLIGSNNAAVIGSIGPISTIILAYIFLGETFGVLEILGTSLVIGGVLLISLKK